MAIFAFGATYDGVDVSGTFLNLGVACSGWKPSGAPNANPALPNGDAPFVEALLHSIRTGDIAIIKAKPPGNGLRIKGVGIVTDARPHAITKDAGYPLAQFHPGWDSLGLGVKVRWVWPDRFDESSWWMSSVRDGGGNMRTGTVYEEFGPEVAQQAIKLLLTPSIRQ